MVRLFESLILSAYVSIALVIAHPLTGIRTDGSDNLEERGNFFEGDIILDARNGIIGDEYRWPNNTVVYTIDPEFSESEEEKLQAAWNEIAENTCIKFREATSEDSQSVLVRRMEDGAGCSSNVGHRAPSQQLGTELHRSSWNADPCNDIGFYLLAIGFYHEQSRPDHDDFVTIVYDKIEPGKEHNFNKYDYSQVTTLDVNYDYSSIMHYSAFGFSIDDSPTIIAKEETNLRMGQRVEMSGSDILKIQRIYGCDLTPPPEYL